MTTPRGFWIEAGPWERVPNWHPARWFGYTQRQMLYLCGGLGDEPEHWNYGTDLDAAEDFLKRSFASE